MGERSAVRLCQIEDIKKYLKRFKNVEVRKTVAEGYAKYKQMEPKCEKMLPFEALVKVCRQDQPRSA